MTGPDALTFLQGMVTNDVRHLDTPGAPPVYAAVLTPKGKFLHDLFIFRSSSVGAEATPQLLLDVDADGKAAALAWLSRYKLRRKVLLEDASSDFAVWAAVGGSRSSSSNDTQEGAAASGTGWRADPRLPDLGRRGIFPSHQPPAASASSAAAAAAGAGAVAHRQLRYRLGVGEGEAEIPAKGVSAPLEFNLDVLHGVSYTKGCYVGQERNSFTHFRGIVRRRLMPVVLHGGGEGATGAQPGATIELSGQPGRSVGSLLGLEGSYGIAHVRLAPALAALAGEGPQLQLAGSSTVVHPRRPYWWPPEWGFEESEAGPQPPST